jgi:hypothetical protein
MASLDVPHQACVAGRASGELAGVLSLDDVIEALAAQLRDATGSISKGLATEPLLRA